MKRLRKLKGFEQIYVSDKLKTIKSWHKEEEWIQDKVGYFLIRINKENKTIEVGFCTNDHIMRYKIIGKKVEDIYYTIIRNKLISRLDHAAYLGMELEKAFIALEHDLEYVQCKEIKIK